MPGYIDLHIHSKFSNDGSLSPDEIASRAKELDFSIIAIADHDTLDGIPEGVLAAQKYSIEIIPAVEVTTELDSHFFHILAYYVAITNPATLRLITRLKEIRINKNLFRVDRIYKLGLRISDDFIALVKKGVLVVGPTLARNVFQQDVNKNHPVIQQLHAKYGKDAIISFYKEIIKKIDREYENQRWLSTLEAITLINAAAAVPVLAHPGASLFYAPVELIARLKKHGLEGLEVFSTYHTPDAIAFYYKVARDYNLLITGGSDFHGAIKPNVSFGCIKINDHSIVERLKQAHQNKT
jgi:3',5'-nucleoside bisphosphate phosphatase